MTARWIMGAALAACAGLVLWAWVLGTVGMQPAPAHAPERTPASVTQPAPVPSCPVEDECEVDFRGGAWWLRWAPDGATPGPWVRVSG